TIGDPTAMISPDLFDVASAWWLEPGLAVPVEANFRTCRALLVDGPELAPSLFYWRSDSYPAMWLPAGDVDALGMRALRIVPGQTRARFQENGVRFAAPERVSDAPEPACEVPAEGTTAGWTEPPATGGGVIEALSTGPDGCHAIDVPAGRWYFCAPGVPFPFEVGDEIQIGQFSDGGRVGFGLSSGPVTLFVENTVSSFATAAVAGCPGHRDACGGFTRPLALRVPLDGQLVEVRAGESVTLDSGATLYVLRAELPSVIDLECTSVTAVGVRAQTITLIDRRQ
ncbi:MAG: hypothetical protein KC620_20735, partial [Myxococcales bacterium]|nr:hypothetical protein [Myxococcales bacterium]